jgi:transcriptional antiterminator RfaH
MILQGNACLHRSFGIMLQLGDNPPVIWPESALAEEPPLHWAAVYTKPRQEKALAWDLRHKGITYFLPMVLRETSSGGRRRRNLYALFPSYLFVAGGEAQQLAALKTDRIVRLVHAKPSEQAQLRQELSAFELALRHFPQSLELHPRLTPGVPARIKAGPMAGVEGLVLQSGASNKLWLAVSCLGVGATVEIHPDFVEAI